MLFFVAGWDQPPSPRSGAAATGIQWPFGRADYAHSHLQIMLWGGPVATVRSRDFFVTYPVSFPLRYLYIRPISRHVCLSVCLSVGHRESSPEDTGPQYSYSSRVPYFLLHCVNRKRTKKQSYEYSYRNRSC